MKHDDTRRINNKSTKHNTERKKEKTQPIKHFTIAKDKKQREETQPQNFLGIICFDPL